jgi:hypothetical protein
VSGAEPNAVGQVVCDLIPVLPENVVTDLARLLSASLADPSFIQRSTIRLGVLIGVVADGTGEIPSTRAYDDARKAAVDGDAFPTASGLSRVYGGWLNAVEAAMAIHFNDHARRAVRSGAWTGLHPRYTREEVVAAILRFRDTFGAFPSRTEFERWGRIARRLARAGGHPDPRIPTAGPVKKSYPNFAAAVEAAQRLCPPAT